MAQSFIELNFQTLTSLFPNVDPDYLESIAIDCEHDEAALQVHIENMLDPNSDHPTRENWVNRRKTQQLESEFNEEFWNVEHFLKKIPDKDPCNYFFKVKPASKGGVGHESQSLSYLLNRYPHTSLTQLQHTLKQHDWSLVRTVTHLEQTSRCLRSRTNASRFCKHHCMSKKSRMCEACYMRMVDTGATSKEIQSFFLEATYIEHMEEVDDYMSTMAVHRLHSLEQARLMNMLAQCECCFDNEILPDETVSCSGGHLFCEPCVQKYVKIRIGDAANTFPCMSGDCTNGVFSLKTLQHVMEPREFSAFLRQQQLEEIKSAGIEDLESCPFCGFSNIVDERSKVFQCEGEECGRESCRKCKKETHVPFDCDELQKNEDRDRKYVEDKLSEALIRECYKCHKKFIKENTGCNHITCPSCQSHMCYVCRQPLDPSNIYAHFVGQGGVADGRRCPLYSNVNLLHVEALESVAQAVEQEIRTSNSTLDVASYVPQRIKGVQQVVGAPDMRDTVLRHTLKAANLNKK